MYCDKCGTQLRDGDSFCYSCGRSFVETAAPKAYQPPPAGRLARHATTLGVLWIVYSVLHLLPAFAALSLGALHLPRVMEVRHAFFAGPVFATFAGFMGLLSILGIVAGFALLSYQPWARVFLLVLGFLALLSFPFGTALGIYTIWALLSGGSDWELRQMARQRRCP